MNQLTEINVVWLKKDLRLSDHASFEAAGAANCPVLVVFIFEPSILNAADSAPRHWRFASESLREMNASAPLQGSIHYFHMECEEAFLTIMDKFRIKNVYSHQETGNLVSFERDKRMKTFFKNESIHWQEFPTNGVVRGLKNRTNWSENWEKTMIQPLQIVNWHSCSLAHIPEYLQFPSEIESFIQQEKENAQKGGSSWAWKYLLSFLEKRHVGYGRNISKPEASRKGCSRISPYLTWGNISMREAYQATIIKYHQGGRKRDLSLFIARLHWHCHFIQKLESEYTIEFKNLNSGFDSIRTAENSNFVEAWKNGKTGIPMIDACMRCVVETGYINFRMRSMLVSFLTHHLQQPWQTGVHHLAKAFLDYEPGIHFSQFQMQAGTMGVNTIRIYNPVKQGIDHDPNGDFIKKWVPELAALPANHVHEPWKMSEMERIFYTIRLGEDYPLPIVDIESSAKNAREILWSVKRSDEVKKNNPQILKLHTKNIGKKELPNIPKQ